MRVSIVTPCMTRSQSQRKLLSSCLGLKWQWVTSLRRLTVEGHEQQRELSSRFCVIGKEEFLGSCRPIFPSHRFGLLFWPTRVGTNLRKSAALRRVHWYTGVWVFLCWVFFFSSVGESVKLKCCLRTFSLVGVALSVQGGTLEGASSWKRWFCERF